MTSGIILFLATSLSVARLVAAEPVPSATMLEGRVLCIRVGHLAENFAAQLPLLQPTNPPAGTVLDLRFADGDSRALEEAVKTFSTQKPPLLILVNSQTRGAAADLALRLRTMNAAIVIGSTNAPGALSPDVVVAVSAEDEKQFQDDPYAWPATNSPRTLAATNHLLAFVDHTSEAELVRKRIKDGDDLGSLATPRAEPSQPVIRDPALARAVDLLKALAALRKTSQG